VSIEGMQRAAGTEEKMHLAPFLWACAIAFLGGGLIILVIRLTTPKNAPPQLHPYTTTAPTPAHTK